MIILLIFYVHTVAAVAIFTTRWQESNLKEGLLAVGFVVLSFIVGWQMATFVLKLVVDEEGFGAWLDRDALSLVLITVGEGVFYGMQLKKKRAGRP